MDMKVLTRDNYQEVVPYFSYAQPHMSLCSFTTQYIWRNETALQYFIKDDMLYLFEKNYHFSAVCPMGSGDLKKSIQNIKDLGISKTIYCINEEQKDQLKDHYEVKPYRDFFEYVYQVSDLISLKGKKYAKKRNHIKKFTSLFSYEYRKINKSDTKEIKLMIDKWCDNRDDEQEEHKDEKTAIIELLKNDIDIDFKASAIYVGNDMVAFAIGEQIAKDMVVIHFEKADIEYPGLYQVMVRDYLSNEWPDVQFVNRQEDLGIPGLKKSKESYYPSHFVKNYCINCE